MTPPSATVPTETELPEGLPPQIASAPPAGPLTVLVIGAGIGGLSAAIALRKAGHIVHLYEKSAFANEVGAAIHVGPNASRVLGSFGYSEERMSGVECSFSVMLDKSGKTVFTTDNTDAKKTHGSPWYLSHRVDLHSELKHLALSPDTSPHPPCILHLSTLVTGVDAEAGTITHTGPSTIPSKGDLIVGADGINSKIRQIVFPDTTPAVPTGFSAFRFVIPTAKLRTDPETAQFGTPDRDGGKKWAMKIAFEKERRIVMYPCRKGELMNFVCIHPDELRDEGKTDQAEGYWNTPTNILSLTSVYTDYTKCFQRIFTHLSEGDVTLWQLRTLPPLPTWIKGRLALLGDACHPMMPHLGQGGGQSIEDGAALGVLFPSGARPESVEARLKVYQHVRKERAETVQDFSRKLGMAKKGMGYSAAEVHQYIFSHRVEEYAKQSMSAIFIPPNGAADFGVL
ncbi:FAD/NAD(P)-binding domain-containing protein [Morchella snyderi]|nr:FAD/NAD(P)-binding domain-containing protein [Morchella snyderi]